MLIGKVMETVIKLYRGDTATLDQTHASTVWPLPSAFQIRFVMHSAWLLSLTLLRN